MQGISEFLTFWLLYLGFATLAFWCWRRMFFWLEADSELRRFFHMLGAVLLYTPAPIEAGSEYFAPAFVVFPFTALTTGLADAMYALNWYLSALVTGALLLAIAQIVRKISSITEKAAD